MLRRFITAIVGVVAALTMSVAPALADTGSAATVPPGAPVAEPINCRPDASHPNPVIVLPGGDGLVADTESQWDTMLSTLRGAGFCAVTFQGGVVDGRRWGGDMPTSARQLGDYVAEVKAATGAAKVDIVAHSAGGFVTNYYAKVLGGGANLRSVVLLAPETRGVDGTGFLEQSGVTGMSVTPVDLLRQVPGLRASLSTAMPKMASMLQVLPGSPAYHAVMDGPLAIEGVRYAVLATRNDRVATPAGASSFILEPGVTNVFYEDEFPAAAPVDHSTLRSSPLTAAWVVSQLVS
ncbi:esterase/lipase family protein [Nocardia camponoti]|uniref:Lipase n=1 Tax=Nocardia camponoti TaxID=1616106 RepID=A0A917QM32_9NOCA|nr:hypothetical protein [Nocardia camponoti]GGK58201.1 lipase [Nocardia camponoti]